MKHVISATIDVDKLTNHCVGSGRVKLRLGPNENLETVKETYEKCGYIVVEHSENPKKKPNFTQDVRSPCKEIINSKQ